MNRYASKTNVPSEKSRMEIERTLMRYGATGFMYMWKGNDAVIAFEFGKYHIRLNVPMPDKNSTEFTHTETGRERTNPDAMFAAWEQASRQRWRAILLIIKAKLESIESGIRSMEQEFMGDFVLADGSTVSEYMLPKIVNAVQLGKMPQLALPGPSDAS